MSYPNSFEDFLRTKVFIINLEKRPEKFETTLKKCKENGFSNIERFDAIDPVKMDISQICDKFHVYPRESYQNKKGVIGCFLSHMSILEKAIQEKIPYFLIFEDDIEFIQNFKTHAKNYWEITPKDFDILYVGSWIRDEAAKFDDLSKHIIKAPCLCTHAMLYTMSGACKVYSVLQKHQIYEIDFVLHNEQTHMLLSKNEINNPPKIVSRSHRLRQPAINLQKSKENFIWYVWNDKPVIQDKPSNVGFDGLIYQRNEKSDVNVTY